MIVVNSLCRSYGDFTAVDQVSFTIQKGEIVGLLGHNGAGKTTIMKMLTGYLEADSGTVSIHGDHPLDERGHAKANIGYLPENLPLYPEMMVADYLEYIAGLRDIDAAKQWRAVYKAMQQTDLLPKATALISTLSRGYKQRVGVAQAIIHQPKVLILDEPMNGLDPTQAMHMRELIKRSARDATVILSTHIMQEVEAVCDRVMILRNGQLVVDESLQSLGDDHQLLLQTNANLDQLTSALNTIPLIEHIEFSISTPSASEYLVTLSKEADRSQVCATISAKLIQAGYELSLLAPVKRDLETLFRQVNRIEEQKHVV